MNKPELYDHPGWRWCTSEGASEQVLRLGLKTTFLEKVQWLEEAETLSLQMKIRRKKAPQDIHGENR